MKTHIVLFQPEIPQNTGNIIRTAVATGATLHLIKPYGFDLSLNDRLFKRNSTNYFKLAEIKEYENFQEFEEKMQPKNLYILTRYGKQTYDKIDLTKEQEVFYLFGSESTGVTPEILEKYQETTFRIPMKKVMRSLNLSNCVALIVYDGLRQQGFRDLALEEPHKK